VGLYTGVGIYLDRSMIFIAKGFYYIYLALYIFYTHHFLDRQFERGEEDEQIREDGGSVQVGVGLGVGVRDGL